MPHCCVSTTHTHRNKPVHTSLHTILCNPSRCMELIYWTKHTKVDTKIYKKVNIVQFRLPNEIRNQNINSEYENNKWKKCKGPCKFHTTHINNMSKQQATVGCRWWVLTGGGSPRWADESAPPPGQTRANQEALCPTPPARATKQIQHCATTWVSGILASTSQQIKLHTRCVSQCVYLHQTRLTLISTCSYVI